MIKPAYFILCFLMSIANAFGQTSEGIFLSFESFVSGRPDLPIQQLDHASQEAVNYLSINASGVIEKINYTAAGESKNLNIESIFAIAINGRQYIKAEGFGKKTGKRKHILLSKLYGTNCPLMSYTIAEAPKASRNGGGPSVGLGMGAMSMGGMGGSMMGTGISSGGGNNPPAMYNRSIKKITFCLDTQTGEIINRTQNPKKIIKRLKKIDPSLKGKKITKENLDLYLNDFQAQYMSK